MDFVDLKRCFAPIEKDQEANLDIGRIWGRRMANWLDWSDLLAHRRVVLLAEALSGKTEEFRHQTEALVAQGKAAFFVRIEDLADDGFEAALEPQASRAFEHWRDGCESIPGWFFLDSVDEARLNNKSLEKALRRFARDIDRGLERAFVYVSCRVSDWKGSDDREAVERLLPVWEQPTPPAQEGDDTALLAPIFGPASETREPRATKEPKRELDTLLVVQLVPLAAPQWRLLAEAAEVERPESFVEAIERNGLDPLADRPGDLLDLAEYWKERGHFASLAEITEHGVAHKLAERDSHRPDNTALAPEKVRAGAERLAAALTLAKSFTLRASGRDPDPLLAAGAVDPAQVLPDWTDAERNALMRRGVFAPSTYGRLRFHHRGTQEYLTARWLERMLQEGCRRDAVWDLVFAERYDIRTLVPSLHAAAAWLALNNPDVRDEIVAREPLVLLRDGDPRALPLETKERLLLIYAGRHAAGEISNDSLDRRALWMFATPELAGAIRQSWAVNDRQDFRTDLLLLVREGMIHACADLARGAALDERANDYQRTVALQALDACGDTEGLAAAARWLKGAPGAGSARLAPCFAKVLFPRYLTVDELLDLIGRTPAPKRGVLDGFGYGLSELWEACPDAAASERFLAGLADLSLAPPFEAKYRRISARHRELAKNFAPPARKAVLGLADAEPSEGLVRLLMVVERAERDMPIDREEPPLSTLVCRNPRLQRKLFWADVEETRQNANLGEDRPAHIFDVYISGGPLWQLATRDLDWLLEDLSKCPLEADKRIALSGVIAILRAGGRLQAEVLRLRTLIAGHTKLERYLSECLTPPKESEQEVQFRLEEQRQQKAHDHVEREAKASWLRFRDELKADPSPLRDPSQLANWSTGAFRLDNLSRWLCGTTKKNHVEATRQWRLLEEGFGRPVAEAFRNGMKAFWRVTEPERPKHLKGGGSNVKYTTIMSLAGLGLEAADDPDWASSLTTADAERAAQHACLSEQGYPNWIEQLVDQHPAITLPILHKTLMNEWQGRHGGSADFLSHYASARGPIPPLIQGILFEVIKGKPKTSDMLDRGLRVLRSIELSERQRSQTAALARRRLRAARAAGEDERVRSYLAMLFLVDANDATRELVDWLDGSPQASRDARAQTSLGALFGRDSPAVGFLASASVACLEALVRLAYRNVRPQDDRVHEGAYTPDVRDNAESARTALLNALLHRPGPDAYRAMRTLAADEAFRALAVRLNELAHGMAERDSEPLAWTPSDVIAFERRHITPARTGEALLHVLMAVLSDIQSSFDQADATSRSVLQRAESEDEVQGWLAEQMNLRSHGRFHAYREARVARGDKPDIIVASTTAQVEVAVEVKHSGMGWTVRDLERALTKQLAETYLKPATRRHGVLVLSHHGRRTWRDPDTRAILNFHDVLNRLQRLAATLVTNQFGPVEVRIFGIDASRWIDLRSGGSWNP